MRALAISAVVGAMVLTGCQSTGNNIGGVEYDKAALGTLIGAAAGYGISKGNANTSRQNNRAAAIGAVVGGATGVYLDNKEKKLRQQMAGTGVEVNRNPDGSVGLVMPGNITFDTNKSNIKPNFYSTLNKVAQTLTEDNKSGILVTGYTDSTGNDSINIPEIITCSDGCICLNLEAGWGILHHHINHAAGCIAFHISSKRLGNHEAFHRS